MQIIKIINILKIILILISISAQPANISRILLLSFHPSPLPPPPSSGIISGANVIKASKPIGGMWIALSFLWLLLVPWAAIMIFLVSTYHTLINKNTNKYIIIIIIIIIRFIVIIVFLGVH